MFILQKAKRPKGPTSKAKEFRSLDRIASSLEPTYQASLTKGINNVKQSVKPSTILRDLKSGDARGVLNKIPFEDLGIEFEKIQPISKKGMVKAGASMERFIPKVHDVKFAFNPENPAIDNFLKKQIGSMIQDVTDNSLKAVQSSIKMGMERGLSATKMSELIPKTIGLNERQSLALLNREAKLIEQGFTGPKLKKQIDIYEKQLLKQRTRMIARTESMRAVNEGHKITIDQAVEEGFADRNKTTKTWVTTIDESTGDSDAEMDGQKRKLNDLFEDPLGVFDSVSAPPLHPNCRCVVTYNFEV